MVVVVVRMAVDGRLGFVLGIAGWDVGRVEWVFMRGKWEVALLVGVYWVVVGGYGGVRGVVVL